VVTLQLDFIKYAHIGVLPEIPRQGMDHSGGLAQNVGGEN
jgi:hypothetical protein